MSGGAAIEGKGKGRTDRQIDTHTKRGSSDENELDLKTRSCSARFTPYAHSTPEQYSAVPAVIEWLASQQGTHRLIDFFLPPHYDYTTSIPFPTNLLLPPPLPLSTHTHTPKCGHNM